MSVLESPPPFQLSSKHDDFAGLRRQLASPFGPPLSSVARNVRDAAPANHVLRLEKPRRTTPNGMLYLTVNEELVREGWREVKIGAAVSCCSLLKAWSLWQSWVSKVEPDAHAFHRMSVPRVNEQHADDLTLSRLRNEKTGQHA